MATEVAHEPATERKPMGLREGTDVLSGILSREQEVEQEPTVDEPETEEPVQAEETESEEVAEPKESDEPVKEAKEEPAEPETEVTSEVELEPAQVAEILGLEEDAIDVDDDGGIQINAKIDGKPAKVSLKDLRHSYELAQTHEERLRQLGRERKSFQEESQAALERLTNQHQQFEQSIKALEEDFATDFQSVDWTNLRVEDPTEYNSKRLDYEDRKKRIEEYRARAAQQGQALSQEYQQRLAQQQAEGAKWLQEEFSGTAYKNAPKWDEEESQRLAKWIMDQGFKQEDIASVAIPQIFKWARDSMLREQELKTAQETVKKVARKTKVSKPGKTKPASEIKKGKLQELKVKQRKSGGRMTESTDRISGILRGN